MHCWHQARHASSARATATATATSRSTRTKSMEVYREWLAKTRPAPGPGGLRRPLHFARAVRPADEAYFVKE